MVKRPAPVEAGSRSTKRIKLIPDRLSDLSDELLLRIFTNLSIEDLNTCQRVSHHFQKLAVDSQLWKAAYYDRFIRPRLLRLPGRKQAVLDSGTLSYSSRLSKWLDERHLVQRGQNVDWKRRYKVRHNWACGSCDVRQIPVTTRPPSPPILARLHNGIVYTVDSQDGLRAWSYKDEPVLLSKHALTDSRKEKRQRLPISFAVDLQTGATDKQLMVAGYDDGSFDVYCYSKSERSFHRLYTHLPSPPGPIAAVAISFPYVLSMVDSQTLSLRKFTTSTTDAAAKVEGIETPSLPLPPPQLLASLNSHTVWSPLALSLRITGPNITASIAYSLPSYQSGWSVGIQELHLTPSGDLLSSRIASALTQGFAPLTSVFSAGLSGPPSPSPGSIPSLSHPSRGDDHSKPTSLSYSHPYILLSHPDNTLTLYLANSTASSLSISSGRRLFGHTSSVFSAHVEGRGKAVSVGLQENDIRVWELEGSTLSSSSSSFTSGRSRTKVEDTSIRINPAIVGNETRPATPQRLASLSDALAQRGDGLGIASASMVGDRFLTRGWVGFDDENLVVLREHGQGGQALAVYDFS